MSTLNKDSFKVDDYTVFKAKTGYYYLRVKRGIEFSLGTKNKTNAKEAAKVAILEIHNRRIIELTKIDRRDCVQKA